MRETRHHCFIMASLSDVSPDLADAKACLFLAIKHTASEDIHTVVNSAWQKLSEREFLHFLQYASEQLAPFINDPYLHERMALRTMMSSASTSVVSNWCRNATGASLESRPESQAVLKPSSTLEPDASKFDAAASVGLME